VSVSVPEGAQARVSFLFRRRGVEGEVELDGKRVQADAPHVRLPDAGNRPRGTKAAATDWSLFGVDIPPGAHELGFLAKKEGPGLDPEQLHVLCDTRRRLVAGQTVTVRHPEVAAPRRDRGDVLLPQNWAWEERSCSLQPGR
jgi:hypothetical protein